MNRTPINRATAAKRLSTPIVSTRLESGELVELIHDQSTEETSFVVGNKDSFRIEKTVRYTTGQTLVPYSGANTLLRHGVILFPSLPEEYGSTEQLISAIREYIRAYVTVSPEFEIVSAYYVLFTWLYDGFNELPYLRVRGDYGSGKTRFLLTVGSICYKPIFASGASTISPLFHMLDAFQGTLVVDEADFRVSDDKAEIVKILNNGNSRGFPVLRSEQHASGEFRPRAFSVFGPKLVATRSRYKDAALESRFVTEDMNRQVSAPKVPLNLPSHQAIEALRLRNKLLLYRIRHFEGPRAVEVSGLKIEPRLRVVSKIFRTFDWAAVSVSHQAAELAS